MTNKESQTIEFKSKWHDEYLKTICAFTNTNGGKIIIGISDKGDTLGVKNIKKLMEDIPNKIRNKLGITPSVEIERKHRRGHRTAKTIVLDIMACEIYGILCFSDHISYQLFSFVR